MIDPTAADAQEQGRAALVELQRDLSEIAATFAGIEKQRAAMLAKGKGLAEQFAESMRRLRVAQGEEEPVEDGQ